MIIVISVSFSIDETMINAFGFTDLEVVYMNTNTQTHQMDSPAAHCAQQLISLCKMLLYLYRNMHMASVECVTWCAGAPSILHVRRADTYAMRNEHIPLTMNAHMWHWCCICNSCETSYTDYFFHCCRSSRCAVLLKHTYGWESFRSLICDKNINERWRVSHFIWIFFRHRWRCRRYQVSPVEEKSVISKKNFAFKFNYVETDLKAGSRLLSDEFNEFRFRLSFVFVECIEDACELRLCFWNIDRKLSVAIETAKVRAQHPETEEHRKYIVCRR